MKVAEEFASEPSEAFEACEAFGAWESSLGIINSRSFIDFQDQPWKEDHGNEQMKMNKLKISHSL